MKKSVLIFVLGIWLTGCMKSADQQLDPREEMIYKQQWKLEDITQKSLLNPAADSSILLPCHADDRIILAANGSFQMQDNATTCDSTILKYDNGIWLISVDKQKLLLSGQKTEKIWDILVLTDSTLRISWMDSTSANNKARKIISMTSR